MAIDDRRQTWEMYGSAWTAETAEAKTAALRASADGACSYRDPLGGADGHAALVEYMLLFHRQVPGGHFETTYFQAHNDRSIAKWNMRNGQGVVIGEGVSCGAYGANGKLVSITGFFETPAE